MLKKALLFFCLFIPLFYTFSLQGQSLHYDNMIVEKIDVVVMNLPPGAAFDCKSILSRIKTREGAPFSQVDFDNDLKILTHDFDRIEPRIVANDDKLFISLRIWPKAKIRSIDWHGNCHIEDSKLQKELGINAGTVFDRLAFNKAFHKVKAYYVKKGYFEAQLNYGVTVDDLCNEVDIDVDIVEGRCGRVKDIIFHGFTCEEQCDIEELLCTKKWNFFTSWMTNEGTYNEDAIQQDQMNILNYLQNEGYADAKVGIEVCEAKSCNRIIIHITAEKGEIYSIGRIRYKGNCVITDPQVEALIDVDPGDPYSPDDIRDTINAITTHYGNCGYIDAFVDYEPHLDIGGCSYSIDFNIEEGEQFCVGLIKVLGNCNTQTHVILHECLLCPGEVFNIEKLRKTEERLRNIGYFCNVNVYAVKSTSECSECGNFRDVMIEVEEDNTGSFGAFMGYSTVESLFAGFNITEKNFNHRGLSSVFGEGYHALRGGGEYAHFTATIGAKSRSFVLSWTKPYFRDTPWIVGFDIERSNVRYISDDYDINAWGFSLHAKYQINPFLRFGWHYRLRDSQVKFRGEEVSTAAQKAADNDGLISASGVGLTYDSRDQVARPTTGTYSRLQTEYAGLGGKASFASIAYCNTIYFPICKKGVMKYRADFKFIQPLWGDTFDDIPLDERFFLGGDDSIRGFRPYAIGPKFELGGDPMGGISLTQFTAEYSYLLTDRIDLFVFADAGSLSDRTWAIEDMKASVGYGMRLKVIDCGPALTIGMGYPLGHQDRSDIKRFFFTIGTRF